MVLAPYLLLMYFSSMITMNCAHSIDLGLEPHQADQAVPALAKKVAPAWLAGILIAAPFAAVMSTVDSALVGDQCLGGARPGPERILPPIVRAHDQAIELFGDSRDRAANLRLGITGTDLYSAADYLLYRGWRSRSSFLAQPGSSLLETGHGARGDHGAPGGSDDVCYLQPVVAVC